MIPKFDHPSYGLTLPSGEKIKYRPFTTKEMKNVLLVSEGGGGDVGAVKAMVELVDVCTFGKLDWLKRPFAVSRRCGRNGLEVQLCWMRCPKPCQCGYHEDHMGTVPRYNGEAVR